MAMNPKRAGWLSIIAALLTPSWWILPQVLAGLGLFGLLSASCLFWLERLQPLFLAVALGALAYQVWAVLRHPPFLRTLGVKVILGVSLTVNLSLIGAWIVLWFRYRW